MKYDGRRQVEEVCCSDHRHSPIYSQSSLIKNNNRRLKSTYPSRVNVYLRSSSASLSFSLLLSRILSLFLLPFHFSLKQMKTDVYRKLRTITNHIFGCFSPLADMFIHFCVLGHKIDQAQLFVSSLGLVQWTEKTHAIFFVGFVLYNGQSLHAGSIGPQWWGSVCFLESRSSICILVWGKNYFLAFSL